MLNGTGIAVIWTRDILTHPEIHHSGDFFSARDNKPATPFWPHWLAE
ncbi:MAG TPA: hypothetical protein VKA38_14120 [Draconibacterium sp.]|nr:hypothetical protein [Draconibacterium sp.]